MTPESFQPSSSGLITSPFALLRDLLGNIAPGGDPIDMTIGEPRHAMPDFIQDKLCAALDGFAKYPPIRGTHSLRQAIAEWIERRYPDLSGMMDLEAHILPLNGSREGLFSAIFPAIERRSFAGRPAVLIPNPFYQCYAAAALAAGAEPIFLPTDKDTAFLPDLNAMASPAGLLSQDKLRLMLLREGVAIMGMQSGDQSSHYAFEPDRREAARELGSMVLTDLDVDEPPRRGIVLIHSFNTWVNEDLTSLHSLELIPPPK